jgi:hypothetical protein
VTDRPTARYTCRTCGHSTDLHGARAGRAPGACHSPGCGCEAFVVVVTGRAPVPNPRHDRDLYLAYDRAARLVESGADGSISDGYELLMAAIDQWYRRAAALPPVGPPPAAARPPEDR